MKRLTIAALCFAVLAVAYITPAAHASYPLPKNATTCERGYRVHIKQVRKHERRHGKLVWVTIRKAVCVKQLVIKPAAPVTTTITTPATPAPTTPVATSVRANIDPDWTLAVTTPQTPPVPVTFTYSASGGDNPLPDGELTLSIFVHASVSSAGGCEANVNADTTNATCTVNLPAWGQYDLITSYTSGVGDVASTGQTETVDVEPPTPTPETVIQQWGISGLSVNPTITANVIGTTASIILTDNSFAGATSVTLTDQLGDTCTASVSELHATCDMTVTGTPTSFTIGYPGGPDDVETQTVTPWGIPQQQQIDYQWPPTTVTITNPTVTLQQAITEWNGGRVSEDGTTYQSWPSSPPAIIDMQTGQTLTIGAFAAGSLATNPFPLGGIDFTLTPTGDYTMTDGQPASASTNCTDSFSYSLEAVGYCNIVFNATGAYTLTPSYLSADAAYVNSTGTSIEINVN